MSLLDGAASNTHTDALGITHTLLVFKAISDNKPKVSGTCAFAALPQAK